MPTTIPVRPRRSWIAATGVALIYALLAASMISATEFIIVQAYTLF